MQKSSIPCIFLWLSKSFLNTTICCLHHFDILYQLPPLTLALFIYFTLYSLNLKLCPLALNMYTLGKKVLTVCPTYAIPNSIYFYQVSR